MGEQDEEQMIAIWVGVPAVGQSQAEAPRQLSSLLIGPWRIYWIRWQLVGTNTVVILSVYFAGSRWDNGIIFLDLLCGTGSLDSLILRHPLLLWSQFTTMNWQSVPFLLPGISNLSVSAVWVEVGSWWCSWIHPDAQTSCFLLNAGKACLKMVDFLVFLGSLQDEAPELCLHPSAGSQWSVTDDTGKGGTGRFLGLHLLCWVVDYSPGNRRLGCPSSSLWASGCAFSEATW